jgi:hypothetical protein
MIVFSFASVLQRFKLILYERVHKIANLSFMLYNSVIKSIYIAK